MNYVCRALVFALLACELQASDTKLNVLLIIVDDLAPVVSAYGGPVSTPALDALAANGVRFTNNYANVPVCGASRASLLSGLAPTAARFLSYDSRLDHDVAGSVSLPAYFQQHGWHTLANGKVFDVIADSAASWSEPVWSPANQWHGKPLDGRGEHLQSAYIEPLPDGRAPYFERLDVADTDYPDGQVAAKTVADLQRLAQHDSPFFLAVGFRKPHLPFNAPAGYWRPAGPAESMLPATWREPTTDMPDMALHRSPELRAQYDALPLFGDPSDSTAIELVRAYYAAVRFADAQVGKVLDGLQRSGAAENTLVILLGDHGFFLGEQRLWTKHSLLEPALRTPLIISHPSIGGGGEVRAVTDLLDVYPTVVELARLPNAAHVQGVSLQPLLENPALRRRESKGAVVARWMNGESVRTQTYRYTRWFDEHGDTIDDMLFDLSADPNEKLNLTSKPEYAQTKDELRSYLASQNSGPIWSDRLEAQYSRWRLASTTTGGLLMVVLAFPVTTLFGLVLLLCALMLVFFRFRKKLHR